MEEKNNINETVNEVSDGINDAANEATKAFNDLTGGTQENKKMIAGILGIVIGSLGVHKFILGYQKEGLMQIGLTVITCGAGGIVGLIEGIIYLTKSDEEFYETYQVNKKPWF